jgi:60 kDa SS-A/Ro ribonucleoprotein
MKPYSRHINRKQTDQMQPIPGRTDMVQNSAGGYTFALDDWARLDRFLILGSEGGTYYASEHKLTVENAECVERCLDTEPAKTISHIARISESKRAPKNDPAIFALAMAAAHSNTEIRHLALATLPRVCRIGTHLFQFNEALDMMRPQWNRSRRRAIANWYKEKEGHDLALQIVKYRNRANWTHRDTLRLSHPVPQDERYDALFKWTTWREKRDENGMLLNALKVSDLKAADKLIYGFELLKEASAIESEKKRLGKIAQLIFDYKLPREAVEGVDTALLKHPEIWSSLLYDMPMTATIRSLGAMSACGFLTMGSDAASAIVTRLHDEERLHRAGVHPINVLAAMLTYGEGKGFRGKLTWTPVTKVTDALDSAFYLCFKNVRPTGKRRLKCMDISGSMDGNTVNGIPFLDARMASAAMALVDANVEPGVEFMGFGTQFCSLKISQKMRLDDVCKYMGSLGMQGTDCSLPFVWALQNCFQFDSFEVWTDNETYAGDIHPIQALQQYRQRTGIAAKSAVIGMTATEFSIADPNDGGMMDFVGLDLNTPNLIADFIGYAEEPVEKMKRRIAVEEEAEVEA